MKRWAIPSLAALAIGVLALTMSAAPARADGIDFNYLNGTITTNGGVVTGTVNGTITVSRNGTTVLCCFNIPATFTFTTGAFSGGTGTGTTPFTWAAGGSVSVSTTGGTVNGSAISAGTLFSGSFNGPQTAEVVGSLAKLNSSFVVGSVNAALAAALNMPTSGSYMGIMQNNLAITSFVNGVPATASLASGDLTVTPTPEPGTLALFGSGLLGIAGLARRYMLKSKS